MKTVLSLILIPFLISCTNNTKNSSANSIEGTWQLISGTLIEKGDTTVTFYNKNVSFIKILNQTHFAFLQHDLNKGQDSSAIFVSGGGRYSLNNNSYTEHLEYCSARNWEGNDFNFTISIKSDTLIQTGVEKVENLGINRLNIEKYVRLSGQLNKE
jgi:Lipocalin-like domain